MKDKSNVRPISKNGIAPDTITRLKSAYGDKLLRVDTEKGPAVFRAPLRSEWDRFIDHCTDDRKSKAQAMRLLCSQCFVWPESADGEPDNEFWSAVVDLTPGVQTQICGELTELAGAKDSVMMEKL